MATRSVEPSEFLLYALSLAYDVFSAGTSALKVCPQFLEPVACLDGCRRVTLPGIPRFRTCQQESILKLSHRTGKRDLGGMLNDGVNSLAR